MITLKNILVATDFSEPAEAALTYGQALARTFNAMLHVVHVVGNVSRIAYGADGYVVALPEMQQEVDDAARKQLDNLLVCAGLPPLAHRRVPEARLIPSERRGKGSRSIRPRSTRAAARRWD